MVGNVFCLNSAEQVVEDSQGEKRCTHMIAGVDRVSEKVSLLRTTCYASFVAQVFCATARGAWILKPTFLEAVNNAHFC